MQGNISSLLSPQSFAPLHKEEIFTHLLFKHANWLFSHLPSSVKEENNVETFIEVRNVYRVNFNALRENQKNLLDTTADWLLLFSKENWQYRPLYPSRQMQCGTPCFISQRPSFWHATSFPWQGIVSPLLSNLKY